MSLQQSQPWPSFIFSQQAIFGSSCAWATEGTARQNAAATKSFFLWVSSSRIFAIERYYSTRRRAQERQSRALVVAGCRQQVHQIARSLAVGHVPECDIEIGRLPEQIEQ